MSIRLRQACVTDVVGIIPFIKMAAGGITEFLLDGLVAGCSSDDMLELALHDENMPYYYKNIIIAEENHRIIAAINYYPSSRHGFPGILESALDEGKLVGIKPLLDLPIDNALYINAIGVDKGYRYSSVGYQLFKQVESIARSHNYHCLLAHVWMGNSLVYSALKIAGFSVVKQFSLVDDDVFQYDTPMALMKGPVLS